VGNTTRTGDVVASKTPHTGTMKTEGEASKRNSDETSIGNGQLWSQFCDDLKEAGDQILAGNSPTDPLTHVEGFRYLTRLLRLSLEKNIEYDNSSYPQFYSLSHETAKIGNDNPDNFYLNCAIDGRRNYQITGNRGSVEYLSIESKAGSFVSGGDMAPTGHVNIDDLQVDHDGNFELILSVEKHAGNWLPLLAESDNVLVRQTFRDRKTDTRASLSIECLNPVRSDVLDSQDFVARFNKVVPFVTGTAGLFARWMDGFSVHVNQLPPNDQSMCLAAGGDPQIHYHNSCWRLTSDQVLVIEFTPPREFRAWNFQLSNYWMESLDYRHHRIAINNSSARLGDDKRVQIIVAHEDPGPGFPNWLTTAGHEVGAMLLRYVGASDFPAVGTRVLTLAELHRAIGV
jgi:hypothetical protein